MQTRLAIGPANYAGQADQWAKAARRFNGWEASSFAYDTRPLRRVRRGGPILFHVDHRLPHPRLTTPLGRRIRRRRLAKTTRLLLDGFVPVGSPVTSSIDADLEYFETRGVALGLISHGSDLRHPDEHKSWCADSYFHHADESWAEAMRRLVERNQTTLERFPDVALFVSTPDLLLHQPRATWLPLTLALDEMPRAPMRPFTRARPKVLHIPSRRQPPIKGTEVIDSVLRKLHERGDVEYIAPESVSHEQMLALMADSDLVVDQLMSGSYGLTAVEAMAMGRIVVGNISPLVAEAMQEAPPIVQATPGDFEVVMRAVLASTDQIADRGEQGRAFVEAWHDGRAAAAALHAWQIAISASDA